MAKIVQKTGAFTVVQPKGIRRFDVKKGGILITSFASLRSALTYVKARALSRHKRVVD